MKTRLFLSILSKLIVLPGIDNLNVLSKTIRLNYNCVPDSLDSEY